MQKEQMEIIPHFRDENTMHSFWVGNGACYRGGELAAGIQVGISRPRMIPLQISRLPPACCLPPLCIPSGFPAGVSPVSHPCRTQHGRVRCWQISAPTEDPAEEQSWTWVQKTTWKEPTQKEPVGSGSWLATLNVRKVLLKWLFNA